MWIFQDHEIQMALSSVDRGYLRLLLTFHSSIKLLFLHELKRFQCRFEIGKIYFSRMRGFKMYERVNTVSFSV